jgi:large subunit ribosomal protein L21
MFAVIKTGGKQYRVAAEDKLKVEKVAGEAGAIVQFTEVLVVGGDTVTLGTPTVAGAAVAAEVLEQGRGPKVISFKKRRRKNSRRKRGHRQELTLVRITEILTDGAKPSKTAKPKAARKPKAKAEAAPEAAAAAGA